ncbi:hypothetical protein Adt_03023 [Abeliophyllum distichum]|uniref:Uncharacterized protein n=1 Tax=Abeliophyllum distichum TaxID=126358 RepID=A0ABD1W0P9_9LAMI
MKVSSFQSTNETKVYFKWNNNDVSNRVVSKETTEPPKGRDEVTSNNILGFLRDNGVVGSKNECNNDVLPELKDDEACEGSFLFDAGSDSRSNPFEEGGEDAIQASHEHLLHWTQAKDNIGGISEANGTLADQKKRETKFESPKRRKSGEITMRSHGYRRMRSQEWLFKSRTLWR